MTSGKAEEKIRAEMTVRVLSTGGGASPPQKVLLKKKFTAISNKDLILTTILRNQ